MKYKTIIQIIFIFTCMLLIIIPLLFTDFKGGSVSKNEKRVLADGPLMLLDNKSAKINITKWIDDNIGFRNKMVELKSLINYKLFVQSSSDKVAIGKDNWLFYIPGNNIDIAKGTYPLSNDELNNINIKLNQCNNILKAHNIKLLVTIAPSKTSIYPEYVKGGNYTRNISPSDIIKKLIKDNIIFIDIKNNLYDYKSNHDELLYWKYNTHWNNLGAFIAYKSIINEINKLENNSLILDENYVFTKSISKGEGDLADMTGLNNMSGFDEEYTIISPKEIKFNKVNIKDKIKEEKGQTIYYYQNDNVTNKINLLCVGDSMFNHQWGMHELLASNVHIFTYSWGGRLSKELIALSKPNYVIIEIIERDTRLLQNINCENLF